jgi:Spy/CpxP family protein refolding chaperone
MKARCIGTVTVMGMLLLLFTLTGAYAQTASPTGNDGAMMPPPPHDGDGAMVPPPPPGGKAGWQHKGKISKKDMGELNLTPEQQKKIKEQRKEQGSAMKSLRESLKAKHEELRAEIDKEKSDKAKIEGITADLKKLEDQRIDQEIKGILQTKETLTPEQFKKLSDMREKREEEKRGGKGKGQGHKRGHGDDGDSDEQGEKAAHCAAPQAQSTPAAAPTVTGSN